MKVAIKIIVIPILTMVFTYMFMLVNTGVKIDQINQIIQPVLFAVCAILCIFFPKHKKNILKISLALLFFMIFSYLFKGLELSNWVGSLGFGLLLITVFSYIPELIKKGYIEKF